MKDETEKKKIAFYIGSLRKGGAERVFVNLADFFLGEGYEVVMVTQYRFEEEYDLPIGAERILSDIGEEKTTRNRIGNFIRRLNKLHVIWKEQKPDLVLSCIGKNNFMTVVSTMGTDTKAVVSVVGEAREEYPTRAMRMLANLLFPCAAGVILQTERSRAFFSGKVGAKAVVLPNSLNPAFIMPRFEGERVKEIVSVGRMDPNKNQEMQLRAFAALRDKYPDYTLTIYGDGELRSFIEELAQELRIAERVRLPGVVPDVAERIGRASLFLLTSYSEGVSNALIEALALGLPVIATKVPSGGTEELIADGVNGLIIPAGDEKALERAMERLLDDPAYADGLGREAAKIQEKLAPERVNAMWKAYFEKIMEKPRAWLAKALCFIGIFLAVLLPISYMVRTNGDVKDRFAGFYAEKKDSLDVVMIGSSPVFPYYAAPKLWGETGIAMYPLSTNVQRPAAMKYLMEEAEKTQSPQLYVFEMRMFTMEEEGLMDNMAYTRGVTDNMRYSISRIQAIRGLVPEDDEEGRLSYYLDIMKYHTNWKMLALPSEWKNMFYRNPHPLKGYTFRDEVGPQPAPDCGGEKGVQPMPTEQEACLRELMALVRENGRDALFLVSPYGESREEQEMFNYMKEIVREEGFPLLNLNDCYEEIGIVFEEDFADYGSHTNAVGAEKCTDYLEAYLLEHYSFSDHRGDAAYASWDAAYQLWKERQAEAVETVRERIANAEYAPREE
ncbi:MAG: glycosyltransferase [Bacteroidales bacterium]|nr:glycosyltransferase [Bacteroidales bacterium]MCM1414578.1 glycosyltransferase [bacterium]MCM1423873.1 glycosyltransferase [bacterium]